MSKPFLIVVDDEPDLGVTIARAVKTLGFDVPCVTDAYAFKAIWSTREPTTIILDVSMPKTGGIELNQGVDPRLP